MAVTHGGYAERSRLTELHTEPDQGGPYTAHLDVWLTRRKRFHMITDHNGNVVFRSRWMGDIIKWLDRHSGHRYTLLGEGLERLATIEPLTAKKEIER